MYTVIRKYDLIPGTLEEFIQQVQTSLVPILSRMSGFRDYYLVEIGDNEVAVVTLFETLVDAKASGQKTMTWINEHTDVYFQGFSKPMAGLVRVHSERAHSSLPTYEELLQGSF